MGNISGQTIEDFVYQDGNIYFNGKLARVDGVPSKLVGGIYKFSDDNIKEFLGQLSIVYSAKKQINFSIQNGLYNSKSNLDISFLRFLCRQVH